MTVINVYFLLELEIHAGSYTVKVRSPLEVRNKVGMFSSEEMSVTVYVVR
jgi:hypothetical protein